MSETLSSNLIRAYVDGELSSEQAARVKQLLQQNPNLSGQIEFEHALRDRIAGSMRSMGSVAPDELRNRITAELSATAHKGEPVADRTGKVQSRQSTPDRTGLLAALAGLFGRPQHINAAAVLAVIALISAIILVGIFGTPIDRITGPQPGNLVTDISEWITSEHTRCANDDDALSKKMRYNCRQRSAMDLVDHLGVDRITVFDLSEAGYSYVGEGHCRVPGAEASAHLIYQRDVPGQPRSTLSIFIAPKAGPWQFLSDQPLQPGQWYEYQCRTKCKRVVRHSTDSSLVYYVLCCDHRDLPAVSDLISRTLAHGLR